MGSEDGRDTAEDTAHDTADGGAGDDTRRARAGSFGTVADDYDRFRPGPPEAVVDWLLPEPVGRVVDLGAGTGALSRLLAGRADEVVAVEPDPRMRAVAARRAPGARVLAGDSEHIPLPDASADAVLVSSAWHWMDPGPTCAEVGRVLRPGGLLGVVWSGIDWEHGVLAQARPLLRAGLGRPGRPRRVLEIPDGAPFGPVEHHRLRWKSERSADELVGMLGTYSSVILLPEDQRAEVAARARALLARQAGLVGDATMAVGFGADCWRARRTGA